MGDLQQVQLPADSNRARPPATLVLVEALRSLATGGTDLLCALSHQLRNPLTSVLGYLEMVAESLLGPVDEEQTRVLRVMIASATRLDAMLDELEQPDPSAGRGR